MTTNPLSRRVLLAVAGISATAIATVAFAQAPKPEASKTEAPKETRLERGKYLVEEVARCQECHSPTLPDGTFDKANWMKGTTLIGVPAKPPEDWHQKAPDITSTSKLWTQWKYEGFVTFLQTSKNPRGHTAGPPMPAYKLKVEDAEAMATYLKSLP